MSTTVAGTASSQGWSPQLQMQYQLQKAVNNGTVNAGDQDALASAMSDISTQLQAGAAGSTGTPAAPGNMKSTIDGLISGEVSSGKLTSDQATELKSVFAQAAQKMHGHGGHGHHHAAPATDDSDDDSSSDPLSLTTPAATAATSFSDFLKQLETSLEDSINGVAGTSASNDTSSTSSASSTSGTSSSSSTSSQASNDPRQLMLTFLQKLESSLSNGNTYGQAGTSSSTNAQAVLVNALA